MLKYVFFNFGFHEAARVIMELLIYFHDYIITILIFIISFVTIAILCIWISPFLNFKLINNHTVELIWTIVPIVILIFLALPRLFILYLMDDMTSPRIVIKVIGHQWYWEYEYTSINKEAFNSYINNNFWYCLSVDNSMVIPLYANIQLLITSVDVIHSWTVPRIGVKVDAVPGRLNRIQFAPVITGIYYGQCSEICGVNHSFMPISIQVLPIKLFIKIIMQL